MSRAAIEQGSFLGGEWSPVAQGNGSDPRYGTALALCLNHMVTEEGALVRRPGTLRIAPTYNNASAKLLEFVSSAGCPFVLECTPGSIRMYDGASLVFTNDSQVITNSSYSSLQITLTTTSAHGWSVGDQIQLNLAGTTDENVFRGQIFTLATGTAGSTLVFPIFGPAPTGFVNGTTLNGSTAYRVKRFDNTGYSAADIPNLRVLQAALNAIILVNDVAPNVVTVNEPPAATEAVFTFGALGMVDGPYLDNQSQSLTMGAVSGSTTLTAGSSVFASTDVGRHVRIFTQPPAYNPASTYTVGQTVTFNQDPLNPVGGWWIALGSVAAGQQPGQVATVAGIPTLLWAPAPTAGNWAWGKITAFTNATTVSFTFDTTIPNMVLQSANGTTASAWRLGVYSGTGGSTGTNGWPTCGVYYEGRIWFMGAVPNRFDASISNGMNALTSTVTWSPTDPYGTVTDASGIGLVLNSATVNIFNWAKTSSQGIVCGTSSAEWLISASAQGDPITPTSIQAHQVTALRSENIEPAEVPMGLIFPQQYGRRVVEYLSDAFTQRFAGEPLNEQSRHMAKSGIALIKYQTEPIPTVWAMTNDGELLGCTYRRISRFITEKPVLQAWSKHQHGGGTITSLAVVPNTTGVDGDRAYIVVKDAFSGYFVELLTPSVEVKPMSSIRDGWFVDSAPAPTINVVGKCGFLYPSSGYRLTSTFTPTDFGEALPTQPFLLAPGTTLPPQGSAGLAFQSLNNGVYFNGESYIANLIAKANTQNFAISFWAYLAGDSGDFFSTPIKAIGTGSTSPGIEFSPFTGLIDNTGLNNSNGNINGGTVQPSMTQLGWNHILLGLKTTAGTSTVVIYVNDTQLQNSTLDVNNVTYALSRFMFGGNKQVNWDGRTLLPAGQNQLNSWAIAGNQIPTGYGLTAGIAEVWIDTNYIDFTVAGNRQKFHTTDLAALRWAPVNLGNQGQTPTGSKPKCYLSALNPKGFRINRANKSRIFTYNNGPFGFFANNIDPASVTLDPLPPTIQTIT